MSLTVACYGAGKNSKYAIAEWVERGNPLHIVTFADVGKMRVANKGAEKDETYADVLNFQEWLMYRGIPCQIVRVTGETLEENCLRRKQLPAIAYGFKTCSQRWKLEPQERFLNRWIVTREAWERGEKVTRLVGYHAGEPQRAIAYEDEKYINRYPLIEWGVDNEGCEEGLRRLGLCVPPKSSCFFCPNMTETEILDLNDQHPDLDGGICRRCGLLGYVELVDRENEFEEKLTQAIQRAYDEGYMTPCKTPEIIAKHVLYAIKHPGEWTGNAKYEPEQAQ